MDYSNFQVKYIGTPIFKSDLPDIKTSEEPMDLDNLKFELAEAAPPTLFILLEQEEKPVVKNPVRKVIKKKVDHIKPSIGLSNFNIAYDLAIAESGDKAEQLRSRRNLLTRIAYRESSFRSHIGNSAGVPAYGYFGFMLGRYRNKDYNNVGIYSGVDLDTFRRSPSIQIKAANNLANDILKSFSKTELLRLHKMGYTDSGIIGGAWLGGVGGVRNFAFKGKDAADSLGTKVSDYMKYFNNID